MIRSLNFIKLYKKCEARYINNIETKEKQKQKQKQSGGIDLF